MGCMTGGEAIQQRQGRWGRELQECIENKGCLTNNVIRMGQTAKECFCGSQNIHEWSQTKHRLALSRPHWNAKIKQASPFGRAAKEQSKSLYCSEGLHCAQMNNTHLLGRVTYWCSPCVLLINQHIPFLCSKYVQCDVLGKKQNTAKLLQNIKCSSKPNGVFFIFQSFLPNIKVFSCAGSTSWGWKPFLRFVLANFWQQPLYLLLTYTHTHTLHISCLFLCLWSGENIYMWERRWELV